MSQKAEILFDPDETCEETLKNYIEALGFNAQILQDTTSNERTIEFEVCLCPNMYFQSILVV